MVVAPLCSSAPTRAGGCAVQGDAARSGRGGMAGVLPCRPAAGFAAAGMEKPVAALATDGRCSRRPRRTTDKLPRRRVGAQPHGRASSPAGERRDTQVGDPSHPSLKVGRLAVVSSRRPSAGRMFPRGGTKALTLHRTTFVVAWLCNSVEARRLTWEHDSPRRPFARRRVRSSLR
jgi:hypothetical protein